MQKRHSKWQGCWRTPWPCTLENNPFYKKRTVTIRLSEGRAQARGEPVKTPVLCPNPNSWCTEWLRHDLRKADRGHRVEQHKAQWVEQHKAQWAEQHFSSSHTSIIFWRRFVWWSECYIPRKGWDRHRSYVSLLTSKEHGSWERKFRFISTSIYP